MKKFLSLFVLLSVLMACRKDEIEDPRNYSASSVVVSDDLPLGGCCVDADGNLIVFSPPTFQKASFGIGDFIRLPSLKKYNGSGQLLHEYSLPAVKSQYYRGYSTWDTIDGTVQAWVPDLKITLAIDKNDEIIISNTNSRFISSYSNGTNDLIVQSNRISAISVDANDTIFALMTATYNYDQDWSLKTPPEIWKVLPDGSTIPFYVFPSHYDYPVGRMWGDGQDFFPSDKPDDISIGKDGWVYVALGFSNRTFRISKAGAMEEITDDIPLPISIATDKFGNIFIASAPLFDSVGFAASKPPEVIEIAPDKSRKTIYSGSQYIKLGSNFLDNIVPGKWVKAECLMDINVSPTGDLFLSNSMNGEIILIY